MSRRTTCAAGGWLALEHGNDTGGNAARALVARGFTHVTSHRDLAGHERVTEGNWPHRKPRVTSV